MRFFVCIRALLHATARNLPKIEGRRSAERRMSKSCPPLLFPSRESRRGTARADRRALAFRRPTADSLRRINASAQLRPRFLGAASSGVTRIFPYPSPASSSQAGHDAGRAVSGAARERSYELRPRAPLPLASIGRHRLTSLKTSEIGPFNSPRGANSRNSAGRRHPSDLTKNHFALFI